MMRCIVWGHVYDIKRISHSKFFPYAYEEVAKTLRKYTELEFGEELARKEFYDCIDQHVKELSTIISELSKVRLQE